MFLRKRVLKKWSKLTGREHPSQSVISIKLQCNFFEIALRHGCSPVNLLHTFRTLFSKNTPERLLLNSSNMLLHLIIKPLDLFNTISLSRTKTLVNNLLPHFSSVTLKYDTRLKWVNEQVLMKEQPRKKYAFSK